ncbi:MAG TPA: type VI secretion system contractile sheath large subunit [Tepidisphaeraceae bacterium]|jgi:type VI secretion system protein ImpC|nr:type VI secretion system contractile sheath large subunit [Tepidisphaeraceae bacterium]
MTIERPHKFASSLLGADFPPGAAIYREVPPRPKIESDDPDEPGSRQWPGVVGLCRSLLPELQQAIESGVSTRRMKDLAGELHVALDREIGRQLAIIMTHPRFTRLEAAWRGLKHLVEVHEHYVGQSLGLRCQIQMVDCSPAELVVDLKREDLLTKSWFFKTVCESTLDIRGGQPIGLLVSGMEFGGEDEFSASHLPYPREPGWQTDRCGGLTLLGKIAQIAEMSLCPFVAAANPRLFGLPDFSRMPEDVDLDITADKFDGAPAGTASPADYWAKLRRMPACRFIALTAPRVVLAPSLSRRETTENWFSWPARNLDAQELEVARLARRPLMGSGAYALAAIVVRSECLTGSPSNIQGIVPLMSAPGANGPSIESEINDSGGLLLLRGDSFKTDIEGVCVRSPVEVTLTGQQERKLGQLGLLAISRIPHADRAGLYTLRMIHQPIYGDDPTSNSTQELHSLLPSILIVTRVAQFAKVYLRRQHGKFNTAKELEFALDNFMGDNFVGTGGNSSRPLTAAAVKMIDTGRGVLECLMSISPRLVADDVLIDGVTSVRVTVGMFNTLLADTPAETVGPG